MNTKTKGIIGEIYASKYLIKNHYKILALNYKTKLGEIDIIASKKDVLVFVEVKLKTNEKYGLAREEVTELKKQKIKSTSIHFMKKYGILGCKCRFDVIEIQDDILTHIDNAF